MGLTRDLCQIIYATGYESLGAECVSRVKQAIQDGMAVALAGCKFPQTVISVEHMRSLGGAPQATVWGWDFKASIVQAAYINGIATHVLDLEPVSMPPTHVVSTTLPVAFALAETLAASGKQLIAAVAKGIEIQQRLQFAGDLYIAEQSRFHPPGVAGVMGSSVSAAALLQLDVRAMQHALGLAASRAGSLAANIGSMTKCTHCGNAAASGLDAALLAKRGFTANPDVMEAPNGYLDSFYPDSFDQARLLAYGQPFRVVDPGLAIKLFPAQYATHYAITAGLEFAPQIPDKSKIALIRVVTPALEHLNRPQPVDGLEGKHSLQYTAAVAILDGAVRIDSFLDARRFRNDMIELLGKTTLIQDPSIPPALHEMRVNIQVELSDGQQLTAVCRRLNGTWGNPLDPRQHRAKLEDCFGRILPPRRVAEVIELLDDLEKQDASGISKIASLLTVTDAI